MDRQIEIEKINIFKKKVYDLVGNEYEVLGNNIIKTKNKSNKIKMRHNCEKCDNHT